MSEKSLISHCAPTLAGLKSANLFSCSCASEAEAKQTVALWNSILNKKGVRAVIMKYHKGRALIYVYRPYKLAAQLND